MISCPSCSSSTVRKINKERIFTDSESPLFKEGYILYECSDCSLWFKDPIPNIDDIVSYYKTLTVENSHWINNTRYPHEQKIDTIINKLPATASILDVGCFTGKLLAAHQDKKLFGIEPSADAAKIASTAHKITIIGETITEHTSEIYKDSFDLITLVDVFEHLRNPREYLQMVFRMLKPGGSLVIVTGRTDTAITKLIGASYWYFIIDSHLVFLNKKYLSSLDLPAYRFEYIPIRHYHVKLTRIVKEVAWSFIWVLLSPHNKNKLVNIPNHLIPAYFKRFRHPLTLTFLKDHALAIIKKV